MHRVHAKNRNHNPGVGGSSPSPATNFLDAAVRRSPGKSRPSPSATLAVAGHIASFTRAGCNASFSDIPVLSIKDAIRTRECLLRSLELLADGELPLMQVNAALPDSGLTCRYWLL